MGDGGPMTNKPCPFCGREEEGCHLNLVVGQHGWYRALCRCGASGPDGTTKPAAWEAWNRRPDQSQSCSEHVYVTMVYDSSPFFCMKCGTEAPGSPEKP